MTTSALATTPTVTVKTSTYTVVGTTPLGATVTETTNHVSTTGAGPEGLPLERGLALAETSTTIAGQTINHIQCERIDQLAYEAYAHLQVYVDGHPRALPGAIGLVNPKSTGSGTTTTYRQGLCTYWIATTAADGVIKIHSPVPNHDTLGELFDIWGQPLNQHRVASARGHVSATVNGRVWRGSPRRIPLREHETIQLAVGRPVPSFKPIDWSQTGL